MGLREELIARLKRDIASLYEGIEWMESGIYKTGDSDGGGRLTDRTQEAIEYYTRTVAELEHTLASLEAEG
jgi:hypothetical protein